MVPSSCRKVTVDSIRAWLQQLALEQYSQVFAENDVDLDTLPLLGEADLEKLGVSLGHRKRMLRGIADLEPGGADPWIERGNSFQPAGGWRRRVRECGHW